MNLGEATVVLRERSTLELADLGVLFVRCLAPKTYLGLGFLVLLPAWGCALALQAFAESWPATWCLALLAAKFCELPFCVLSGRLLFDREVPLKRVLQESLRTLPSYLVASFVYASSMLLSIVIVIGPVIVASSYFFLTEIVVLEKAGARSALLRSKRFLSNEGGTGFEKLLLKLGTSSAFVLLTELLGQSFVEVVLDVHEPIASLWEDGGSAFALLGLFLSIPYVTAFRFLAYINERTKRDGWDIQVAFLRLRSDSPSPETTRPHAA